MSLFGVVWNGVWTSVEVLKSSAKHTQRVLNQQFLTVVSQLSDVYFQWDAGRGL